MSLGLLKKIAIVWMRNVCAVYGVPRLQHLTYNAASSSKRKLERGEPELSSKGEYWNEARSNASFSRLFSFIEPVSILYVYTAASHTKKRRVVETDEEAAECIYSFAMCLGCGLN